MELPGRERSPLEDLMFISGRGIKTILSLTESAPHYDTFLKHRFEWLHFPIVDFDVPEPAPTLALLPELDRRLVDNKPVAVHCLAGLGRTGTILCAYMTYKYRTPTTDVLPWMRRIEPGFVQTDGQERFLRELEPAVLALPPPPPPVGW